MKLDDFLDQRQVRFTHLPHRHAYSANRVAQALHVSGREVAKSVLLRTRSGYLLAVLPATHRIDLDELRREIAESELQLASEDEIERIFNDCERGAMPPFGSMYAVPTVVDETLSQDEEIIFEGQDHEDAIRIRYRDYEAIEHPRHGHFACRR